MSIGIEINQIYETLIDWEKLFTDIKENFKIDIDTEKLIEFCSSNEPKYVRLIEEAEVDRYHIDNKGEMTSIEEEVEEN